ncbi:MAG: hypothetical protein A3E78_03230 [Alphaproteobacteria bacterium RIFCSPHIGHO2_12_FULL_63_12]|nr:MAG: hypothetical protein A3E78_03230 [Alphaproteobacteria bacterium RIFCSPHIGHO2_12_FULL_63_12]
MSFGLTIKQAELLAFLRERQALGGAMPSFDEMAAAINLASKSGISRMVDALVARGAIRQIPGHARSIEIIDMPTSMVDEQTELALCSYCYVTGLARRMVIADALREYFRAHPIPKPDGENS